MGKSYTSTIEIRCWKEHTCVGCGAVYAYEFVRNVPGTGSTQEKAQANARVAADRVLKRSVDLQPCPTCGLYQPDMIGQGRATRHWLIFWVALILLAVFFIIGAAHGMQANTMVWAITVICALVAAMLWSNDTKNLNRDTSANRQLAAERVAAGTVLHQAGRPLNAGMEPPHFSRTVVQRAALLGSAIAIFAAAAPEVLRMSRNWPLNAESYPPVVGAGDTTQIYMGQKINSIKGYWRGQPKVAITEPGGQGLPLAVSAITNQNDWGSTIYAKSSEKNSGSTPWVKVQLPSDSNLTGKTVQCKIDLNVDYPEADGGSSFHTRHTTMSRTVTLQMAPPGAGSTYAAAEWAGTGGAAALVILCTVLLISSARGLQARANPTRIMTLGVPEPQPAAPPVPPMPPVPMR